MTFLPAYVSRAAAEDRAARKLAQAEIAGIKDSDERRRRTAELAARPRPPATLAEVADHIEHVRRIAGVDHVGIGGDFAGMSGAPVGLEDVSKYPHLFAELVRRGWSDAELEKLAGRNLLRALRAAEATARRLQATRGASLATITDLDGARPGAR